MRKRLENFITNSMILVPEGIEPIRRFRDDKKWISSNYRMSIPSRGNNQTQSLEDVQISSFYMSKYPVTKELYNQITGQDELLNQDMHTPKVNISWIDAIIFCNKLSSYFGLDLCYLIDDKSTEVEYIKGANGFRLPTDAEWQYSCKANSDKYQYSDLDAIAWYIDNSNNEVQEVGMKKPNSWGLYDMLGNVWEWCWDLFDIETYDSYRIFRGGSFAEKKRICGATTRRKSFPTFEIDDLGFRVAKSSEIIK